MNICDTTLAAIKIETLDLVVIGAYFVLIVAIGLWAGLKRHGASASKEYYLASNTLTWPLIGLALFSTNISTIHMVGFAEEGYVNGLAYGNFEWMAPFLLIVLALFFAPFYLRSKVATLPDFLEQRYCPGCRNWLAFLSIISAIFIHTCFCLYTGAIVLKSLFGIPIWTSIIVAAVITGIYTIIGGLLAVVVTGALQTIILLAGAFVMTFIALHKVGGWEGLAANVDHVKLTILRPSSDPAHLPWLSVFLGYPVIGLWYWCADQTIVQRVLGAKDENHARIGPLFAGFLKILPVFIFFLPGTAYLALVNKGVLPPLTDTKECYAYAITDLLSPGLTGLMAAALLAALMSTVSGALNSIATLFSFDLYKRWKPETSDRKLVIVGQIATTVGMVIAIVCSRYVEKFETIYQGSSAVVCYLAPPITTVFVFGVFWRKASSKAALATLLAGSLLGLAVFILDINSDWTKWDVPFMYASFSLFVICSMIMTIVSLIYPHQHTELSTRLVWKNPLEALKSQGWSGLGNYKFLAALLFIIMVALYTIFATESTGRFFGLFK
jgi:solute:Na+ symporter, SSS family